MKEEYSSYKFSEDFHLMAGDKKLGYEIVEAILSFLCFYPLLTFILFIVNQSKDDVLDGLLLVVPIIAMVYFKKRIKRLVLFVIVELLIAAAGTVFLWSEKLIVYHFIFLLCYGIYFIVKRVKNINVYWRFTNLAAMNIFLAFIYGFTLINNFALLRTLIFTFSIIHLLVSIIYFHFSSTNKLLQWEKYTDYKHGRNMKTVNVMFSIFIVIILGTVIFMAAQGAIFQWLDALNKSIYNGIFKAINLASTSQNEFMDMEQTPIFNLPKFEGYNEPANTSVFFKLLVLFIKVTFAAVIAVDIIAFAVILFQKLYRRFIRRSNIDEKIESTLTAKDVVDSLKRSFKRPLISLRKAVFKTNKDKLRRLYFQTVMSYKKNGVTIEQWNTPCEIKASINSKHNINIDEITGFYERFRYTAEEPTDNQVADMKKKIAEAGKRR